MVDSLNRRLVEAVWDDFTTEIGGADIVTYSIGRNETLTHRDAHHVSFVPVSIRYGDPVRTDGQLVSNDTRMVRPLFSQTIAHDAHVWGRATSGSTEQTQLESAIDNVERIVHHLIRSAWKVTLTGGANLKGQPITLTWETQTPTGSGRIVRGQLAVLRLQYRVMLLDESPVVPTDQIAPTDGTLTSITQTSITDTDILGLP